MTRVVAGSLTEINVHYDALSSYSRSITAAANACVESASPGEPASSAVRKPSA